MLRRIGESDWPRYADHAWRLAQNLHTSGFPTYLDGVKTRGDFDRSVREGFVDSRDVLMLYEADGTVRGYLHAYRLPEENYASACLFLTEDGWQRDMLRDFMVWARTAWLGTRLEMGFPTENRAACDALAEAGFELLETSAVFTLHVDSDMPVVVSKDVRRMSCERDEASFTRLHNVPDMFWTAERVLADKENWLVYLHRNEGDDDAALLCRKDGRMPEIFGVFYADAFDPEACCALYAACLNDLKAAGCRRLVVFIEDENEAKAIGALGFERKMGYVAYTKKL